jgi:hypothetical protein
MDIFQFMSDSPMLTFFLALIVGSLIFKIYNRTMRMLNIRKHGYPPPHCDADGDFRETEKDETI